MQGYTRVSVYTSISLLCPLRGRREGYDLVAVSPPSTQILGFKFHSPIRAIGFLEETADSRAGADTR